MNYTQMSKFSVYIHDIYTVRAGVTLTYHVSVSRHVVHVVNFLYVYVRELLSKFTNYTDELYINNESWIHGFVYRNFILSVFMRPIDTIFTCADSIFQVSCMPLVWAAGDTYRCGDWHNTERMGAHKDFKYSIRLTKWA